jgi:protoporphyrinogen IX oxidase
MNDFLISFYPWSKTFHIISMTAWMAGLFYFPRLLVYHADISASDFKSQALFQTMEYRLMNAIMKPAMYSTWIFGILLVSTPGIINWHVDTWIYPKFGAVLVLTWLNYWLDKRRADFSAGTNTRSGRLFRIVNEIPTVCLIRIVIMVVVRPI